MLRERPLGAGFASYTPSTPAPSRVSRRAIISPMSPEPRITQRLAGICPNRFT